MIDVLVLAILTAVFTVMFGLITAWAWWWCLIAALVLVLFGAFFWSNADAGSGDWL